MADIVQAPLRAALIGCGRIGAVTRPELRERLGSNWLPLNHAEALKACEGIELVACCDPDSDGLTRAAETYAIPGRYESYERLLSETEIDLLAIATRSDIRPSIIRDAVAKGVRGIHSEKPLALSLAGALSAVEAMRRAGTHFSYGALRRYMPVFQRAREIAAAGELGKVTSVAVQFGRAPLLWTHPHSVDLLCFLAGDAPVVSVQASLDLDPNDASGAIILRDPVVLSATILFSNGIVGQIVPEGGLSADIGGSTSGLSVVGDGHFILHRNHELARECMPERQWTFEPDTAGKSGRLLAIEELRDALLHGACGRLSLDQVADQHRILFAMIQSHLDGGRRVTLDEVSPALTVAPPEGNPPP